MITVSVACPVSRDLLVHQLWCHSEWILPSTSSFSKRAIHRAVSLHYTTESSCYTESNCNKLQSHHAIESGHHWLIPFNSLYSVPHGQVRQWNPAACSCCMAGHFTPHTVNIHERHPQRWQWIGAKPFCTWSMASACPCLCALQHTNSPYTAVMLG